MRFSSVKKYLKWAGVIISFGAVIFSILSYVGFWRWVRGDDLLAALADRLDTSYAEDVSRQVRSSDPEWRPLIRIIKKYASARLLTDKQPVVFARAQAITSAKTNVGEWTAPTTPIYLVYREWPAPAGADPIVIGKDAVLVGTIGDLHDWIRRDVADFEFLWRTVIFGLLSACIGFFLLVSERTEQHS